jgi:L-ascorbate metabolism protein UlaG (beta-lactamase superfamily)
MKAEVRRQSYELHLGAVRFPVTGPVRHTMTARDALELCRVVRPRTVVPIRYADAGVLSASAAFERLLPWRDSHRLTAPS